MVVKTGVSLPDEVYERLVSLSKSLGYTSISKAVRDAVELFIAFNRWWTARGGVAGVIQIAARRGSRGLAELEEAVSEFSDIVRFTARVPVSGGMVFCLVFVEGDGARVKQLYRRIASINGLLAVQPALLPS